jgi:SPP1 family phage portal protein
MIQVNKDFLKNENYIKTVIEKAKKEMKKKQARYNRYTRSASRKDVDVAIEYYATTIATGYFAGVAPEITIKQETNQKKISILKKLFNKIVGKNADKEEFQIMIDYIREYNDDPTVFYNLAKDYFITGSCYALQYENDDNKLIYADIPSTQTVALYDFSTPVQKVGIMRIWTEQDSTGKDVEMVNIITDTEKLYYKNDIKNKKEYKLDVDMTEKVEWLIVPAFAIENPDGLCIFSVVESLIDALETIIKNNKETFEQNADAKLIAIGYAPENEMFIEDEKGNLVVNQARIKEDNAVLNAKMLYVSGDKDNRGDFKWLLKELNDTASENHKKTLIEFIFMILCVPNLTDVGFTNADNSSALEKKFFSLEQLIIQTEKLFKKEYLAMFENFVDRINKKYSTSFDFSEINITFKRNLPTNKLEVVNMWKGLRGIVSDETVISNLPFDIDVETELAKKKEQDEENIMKFQSNMENNKKVGNGDVEEDTGKAKELPKGLQEKTKVNDR